MSVRIRPAVAADQPVIVRLIREARLNPRGLDWRNFLVAEDGDHIVGLRQVKTHARGAREVASGFVLPEYRRSGVSARLMHELLGREKGPLYLMCDQKWTDYYEQFGFRQVSPAQLPPDFAAEYRAGRAVTSVLSLFAGRKIRIVPMRREG